MQHPALTRAWLQLDILSGGITNQLWKVFPGGGSPALQPAVLRLFGEDTDKFIDRAAEERNLLHLNRFGFGAKARAQAGAARWRAASSRDWQTSCRATTDAAGAAGAGHLWQRPLRGAAGAAHTGAGGHVPARPGAAHSAQAAAVPRLRPAWSAGAPDLRHAQALVRRHLLWAARDEQGRCTLSMRVSCCRQHLWPPQVWPHCARRSRPGCSRRLLCSSGCIILLAAADDRKRRFADARQLDFSGTRHAAPMQHFDLDAMAREIDLTEQACLRLGSPVVFGHNDMLAGNILVSEVRPPLVRRQWQPSSAGGALLDAPVGRYALPAHSCALHVGTDHSQLQPACAPTAGSARCWAMAGGLPPHAPLRHAPPPALGTSSTLTHRPRTGQRQHACAPRRAAHRL